MYNVYSSPECIDKKNQASETCLKKIVIDSDMQKICSSSKPTRTSAIDQSLNHVSYNTSRIKTVRILTIETKRTMYLGERETKNLMIRVILV